VEKRQEFLRHCVVTVAYKCFREGKVLYLIFSSVLSHLISYSLSPFISLGTLTQKTLDAIHGSMENLGEEFEQQRLYCRIFS